MAFLKTTLVNKIVDISKLKEGDIIYAKDLGKAGSGKYICLPCPSCHKLRLVDTRYTYRICLNCHNKQIGKNKLANNKYQIDTFWANSIGKVGRTLYVNVACPRCGFIRPIQKKEYIKSMRLCGVSPLCKVCTFGDGSAYYEPYSREFNIYMKDIIRMRDNYACQLCGQKENGKHLTIHHIDYVKKHTNPFNLITLCHACNMRVNWNRSYWTLYFYELLNKRQQNPKYKVPFLTIEQIKLINSPDKRSKNKQLVAI